MGMDVTEPVMGAITKPDAATGKPSPSEQASIIAQHEKEVFLDVECNEPYCLISRKWFEAWRQHTGLLLDREDGSYSVHPLSDQDRPEAPGPIDNSELLCEPPYQLLDEGTGGKELRADAREHKDFSCLFKGSWERLVQWYGGGPAICRPVTVAAGRRTMELQPMKLKVLCSSDCSKELNVAMFKKATVGQMKERLCKLVGVEEIDVQLVDYYNDKFYASLETELDKSLDDARIMDGQSIMLAEKDEHGNFPDWGKESGAAALGSSSPTIMLGGGPLRSYNSYSVLDTVNVFSGTDRGLAGLSNLGNTCFMNSSIQCLAHTVPLLRQLLHGRYKSQVNQENPLGMKGELADAFGSLLDAMWQGNISYVTPRKFKAKIAEWRSQFAGYGQQDSQELLGALLDGLHEDLNRIKQKPYIEEKDADGRPDEDVAHETWENYKARNDSALVDLFQGLAKSTLVCPNCLHRSVKFDPIMYLTLPLPDNRVRTFQATVVHVDGSAGPMKFCVQVPWAGKVGDIYTALATAMGLETDAPEQVLLLAHLQRTASWQLQQYRDLEEPASSLQGWGRQHDDLLAYHYPSPERGPGGEGKRLLVWHTAKRKRNFFFSTSPEFEPIAVPMLLFVRPEDLAEVQWSPAKRAVTGWNCEFAVAGDNLVTESVEAALRPFKRARHGSANGLHAGSPHCSDTSMQDAARDSKAAASDLVEGSMPPGQNGLPADEASEDAAPAAHQGEGWEGEDLVDGDPQDPEDEDMRSAGPSTPQDPLPDTPPKISAFQDAPDWAKEMPSWGDKPQPSSLNGFGDAKSGTSSSLPPVMDANDAAMPKTGPFDMFSAQGQSELAEASGGEEEEEGSASRQAFRLVMCNELRDQRMRTDAAQEWATWDRGHCLSLQWSSWGSALYDVSRLENPEEHDSMKQMRQGGSDRDKPVSLIDCVKAYQMPEQLDKDNEWYCSKCKEHVQATKKLDIWSLPEVLVVHLKRFLHTRTRREKIETPVDFPLEGLDLTPYLLHHQDVPAVYDLYAVSNHFGGLGGGHYNAFAKQPGSDQWYCFDDSSVRQISEEQVCKSSAYVLFYRRRAEARADKGAADFSDAPAAEASPEPALDIRGDENCAVRANGWGLPSSQGKPQPRSLSSSSTGTGLASGLPGSGGLTGGGVLFATSDLRSDTGRDLSSTRSCVLVNGIAHSFSNGVISSRAMMMDPAADDNAEEDLYDVAEEGVAHNLPPAVRFAPWDAQDADPGLGSSSPCGSQGADRGSPIMSDDGLDMLAAAATEMDGQVEQVELSSGDSLPPSRVPPSKAAFAALHKEGVSQDLAGPTFSPST